MKLEWKETEINKISWDNAKKLEKDGWRLPTKDELIDAYHNKVEGFKPKWYWSSSCYWESLLVWCVDFDYGDVVNCKKSGDSYVRLCREVSQ